MLILILAMLNQTRLINKPLRKSHLYQIIQIIKPYMVETYNANELLKMKLVCKNFHRWFNDIVAVIAALPDVMDIMKKARFLAVGSNYLMELNLLPRLQKIVIYQNCADIKSIPPTLKSIKIHHNGTRKIGFKDNTKKLRSLTIVNSTPDYRISLPPVEKFITLSGYFDISKNTPKIISLLPGEYKKTATLCVGYFTHISYTIKLGRLIIYKLQKEDGTKFKVMWRDHKKIINLTPFNSINRFNGVRFVTLNNLN